MKHLTILDKLLAKSNQFRWNASSLCGKQNAPQYQAEIFKIAGQPLGNSKEFYAAAQHLASGVSVTRQIDSDDSYSSAIDEISAKIGGEEKGRSNSRFQARKVRL